MTIDMSPSLVLVVTIGVLVATGVYLVLERSLTRIIIGIVLIGNGINLLLLVAGGAAGGAPIIGMTPATRSSRFTPLPSSTTPMMMRVSERSRTRCLILYPRPSSSPPSSSRSA